MARSALMLNAAGEVIGRVWCSRDEDLALQLFPTVAVDHDHPALHEPEGWTIEERDSVKVPVPTKRADDGAGGHHHAAVS